MRKQIFRTIILVVLIAEIISAASFVYMQYRSSKDEMAASLENEMRYAASGYRHTGTFFFENTKVRDYDRVTLIAPDGKVLYDSYFDADALENHSDRKEFKEALKTGTGRSDRYSSNMMVKTVYYAKRMGDGNVLRLSIRRPSIWKLYTVLWSQTLSMLLLTMIISAVLAHGLAKRLIKPINAIDLNNPLAKPTYTELRPLIERIDVQNKEIAEQIDQLENDVDRKTRESEFRKNFTANVSHELKTPLTSILGYSELIKEGVTDRREAENFAAKIYEESTRLSSLVNDIMTISRLDDEKSFYTMEDVDLYDICGQAISALYPVADRKEIKISLRGNKSIISGAREILYEMVYNVTDNAIRYNRKGGYIDIEVAKNSLIPYIRISDNGIGIPEEERSHIFERFYMVDKARSRELGGTGLGLAIVKHGAKFHGAEINVESEVGVGTTMTITFNSSNKTQGSTNN